MYTFIIFLDGEQRKGGKVQTELDTPIVIDPEFQALIPCLTNEEKDALGSFNFTRAAEEKNAENLLIVNDKTLAERYTKNWWDHSGHSEVYSGRWGQCFLPEIIE
jgi:hypothetical protein